MMGIKSNNILMIKDQKTKWLKWCIY